MNDNRAVRTTYSLMRCLGAAAKYLSKGVFFMPPISWPKKSETADFHSAKSEPAYMPTVSAQKEAAPEGLSKTASPAAELLRSVIEKKSSDEDAFFRAIKFQDKLERVRAEIYVRDFDSDQTSVRMKALDEIKRLSEPAAIGILQRLLAAKKDILQLIEILSALSGLNIEKYIEKGVFKDFLKHSNPILRLAAVRALSRYKDDEVFSMLSASLRDRDPEIRRQALNLLCWTYGDRATTAVLTLLHDADSGVKKTAMLICGSLKLKQAISALITLLSDPDREIQKRACESLKKITKEDFGFKVTGSNKSKEAAVEDWRFWWRENQMDFGM